MVGPSRESRSRDVTVRNTIVYDVSGDGIVLYQVEDGVIETSAAWLTGLQPEPTIGTPNGIWNWRCRRCVVQFTEGVFTDSPGIDGGIYDIDWGNEDNTVQYNYGHDAQGYCLAVFGASGETTSNSIVRHNVCVNNGRSPKLARRQGDVFIQTWAGGSLDGVLVPWRGDDGEAATARRRTPHVDVALGGAGPRVANPCPASRPGTDAAPRAGTATRMPTARALIKDGRHPITLDGRYPV